MTENNKQITRHDNPNIEIAETAGFCYGVKRAVNGAYKLAKGHEIAVTLGQLIHNKSVVSELEKQGIRPVERIEDAKSDETVIIRAHGVGKRIIER